MTQQRDAFLMKYREAAEAVAKETGVPVERILAQAGHETGWNVNAPGNNFFGIKAQPGYEGKHQMLDTTEDFGNGLQNVKQRFRVYDDPADSFRDWAKLMQQGNFKGAMAPGLSDAQYAEALKAGGYATDPGYAKKLLDTITSTRSALGSPEGSTAYAMAPTQNINGPGPGAGPLPPVVDPSQTPPAGQVPAVAQAVARAANPFSLDGSVRNGLALMSAQGPQAQIPDVPTSPIHKPQQTTSLMDMLFPKRNATSFFG
jgi:hypothetical protein